MARTTIIAQAQNADNLTTPGYITPDNISTDLVQYRLSGDNEIFALGTIYTAYQWIIKGDGVNGKVVGSYPPTDTDPVFLSFSAGYNWPQGNVSEIFTYLNAGGPNVKYTKFTYNVKRYNTTSFINPNTRGKGIEWNRNLQNEYTIDVEIYWGKYTMSNLTSLGGTVSNNFFDISELSGETNAAARSLSFSSTGTQLDRLYPEIDLDTRRITKLPRYFLDGSANGHKLCDHFWRIETDDFATTVSAPAPQENTEEVSGTKISELSSTSSLQDDDLLIISRDEGSDGSFDTSYNVSLSNLAAKMINDMPVTSNGWSSGWVDTDGTNSVANGATLTFTHNLGTTDIVTQYYVADNAGGANAKEIVEWARTDFADNPQWYEGGVAITSISLNSISITIAEDGFGIMGAGGYHGGVAASGKYIKIVALKI